MFGDETQTYMLVFLSFALVVGLIVCLMGGSFLLMWGVFKLIKFLRGLDKRAEADELLRAEWYPIVDYDGHTMPHLGEMQPRETRKEPRISAETMPGLMYLAGRPIEARSDESDYFPLVSIMHHQM